MTGAIDSYDLFCYHIPGTQFLYNPTQPIPSRAEPSPNQPRPTQPNPAHPSQAPPTPAHQWSHKLFANALLARGIQQSSLTSDTAADSPIDLPSQRSEKRNSTALTRLMACPTPCKCTHSPRPAIQSCMPDVSGILRPLHLPCFVYKKRATAACVCCDCHPYEPRIVQTLLFPDVSVSSNVSIFWFLNQLARAMLSPSMHALCCD